MVLTVRHDSPVGWRGGGNQWPVIQIEGFFLPLTDVRVHLIIRRLSLFGKGGKAGEARDGIKEVAGPQPILGVPGRAGGRSVLGYSWMRPEFIRSELIQQLTGKFNDVDVQVQTARLRFLGGITVSDLKIIRQTDPTRTPFLHVPTAILHHDKEQLNNGRLVIRKVEMFKPRFQIERDLDGKWNFTEVMKPSSDEEPAPIFVLHDATIVLIDRIHGDAPLAELKNVEATIVNDPAPIFTFQIRGTGRPTGPFTINAKYDKRAGFAGSFDLPNIPIGPDLAQAIEYFCPDAADYAQPLNGQASAHLDLVWRSGPRPVLHHDLRVQLQKGRYAHRNLPVALEEIDAVVRSKNGDLTIEKATARAGQGTISVTMDLPKDASYTSSSQSLVLPSSNGSSASECSTVTEFENRLRSLEVAITNMDLSPEIFAMLPGRAAEINGMLEPLGRFSINYTFKRQNETWQKRLAIEPLGAEAKYRGFPYRVRNLRGQVVQTMSASDPGQIGVDLSGEGLGTTVTMKGTIKGKYPNADVDFQSRGKTRRSTMN